MNGKMMTPLKLIHIATVPDSLIFLRGQTTYMKSHGLVTQVITSPGKLLDEFGEQEEVKVYAVPMERQITPLKDLKAAWRLVRILVTERPAIVHAHTPKGGLLGMLSSFLAHVPVRVYHMRGLPYMTAAGKRRSLLKATERISCRLADRVFCVSHSIRDVAVKDGICPAEKIVVFGGGSGNGVESAKRFNPDRYSAGKRRSIRGELGIAEDEDVVLFVGRIVRDKGVNELAEAWESLRDRWPKVRLVLAGPVEVQDPVRPETMSILRRDDRIILTGSVADTANLYAVADLVVLPTYREGFPNVLLEAASMAIPVVATRVPGCIDAVDDGVTGLLVDSGNAEELALAIGQYLQSSSLRLAHGAAGREKVLREFRQEVIWAGIIQEYRRLLEEKDYSLPSGIE